MRPSYCAFILGGTAAVQDHPNGHSGTPLYYVNVCTLIFEQMHGAGEERRSRRNKAKLIADCARQAQKLSISTLGKFVFN